MRMTRDEHTMTELRESGTMPLPAIVSSPPIRSRPTGFFPVTVLLFLLCAMTSRLHAQTSNDVPVASRILTNIVEIWEMPRPERNQTYRMQTEVNLYYFDAEWNVAWGECNGRPTYLPVADSRRNLRAGQRIAIDGLIVPVRERFIWDESSIQVIAEEIELKPKVIRDLTANSLATRSVLISIEGLIDHMMQDGTHVTLNFIAGNCSATVYVLKGPDGRPQFKEGDYVRLKCIYAPRFDRDGNLSELTLWVARLHDIEVLGSLKEDERFKRPIDLVQTIRDDSTSNYLFHVEGVVRSHEPGKWVTIWDATGQAMIQSKQTQPLRFGDRIEAVGYPFMAGVQQCLHAGTYRLSESTNDVTVEPGKSALCLAERVRELSRQDSGRHLPVTLRALVTWAHPDTPFAYVQDASGGIRVVNPKWQGSEAAKPGAIVSVRGEVGEGEFVPVITNAVVSRVGWWNLDDARLVTLEQALTGVEDGRWVEMRGYVRNTSVNSGLAHLELSTSRGEFQVWTPASQSFEGLKGSIIRARGVCSAICNSRHQLIGIEIWAPDVKCIQVEESAPDDLFAVPLRSLDGLRRFNLQNALNQRVRTAGIVVLQAPGRYLCVQDGEDSVFALSQQQDPLKAGDRVEVVGFPGIEGRRLLLREAVYRRVSSGVEPPPVKLPPVHSVNLDLEGRLARAEGTLLNAVEKDGETRLLLRTQESAFEVSLDSSAAEAVKKLRAVELGSRLAVTGVYEVQSDEYGKPRTFLLHLRSANDAEVLQLPSWWTLARLVRVLLVVLAVSLFALAWGVLIARKNALLLRAHTELEVANDKLELRVSERTQELREQVAAKERAHEELARAQEDLMLTSRRAGMAEVATGVLHNVGNVLNSVNVSTALLNERLRACRVESVGKTAALLREHERDLARFLKEDPKGKAVPNYLKDLAEILMQDKREMQSEIDSLVKNIEHIKVIVGMQQSYAKIGGVLEPMDPKDLAEDAIQINSAGFDRHQIQLIRDFHPVRKVLVDRHKVLQILVNLLNNAKHALGDKPSDKKIVFGLSMPDPGKVRLSVADNGVGIPSENLSRIFSQGFTTRKDGHGFGLHSGANAAKELGGSLCAHSEGVGHGATFVLELPAPDPAATASGSLSGKGKKA